MAEQQGGKIYTKNKNDKYLKISIYKKTLDRWNSIRNSLTLTHANVVIYLLILHLNLINYSDYVIPFHKSLFKRNMLIYVYRT